MIKGLTNAGAMPALDTLMRFSARRQELIAHNVANINTPKFQPRDVSVADFQQTLGKAIDERRTRTGGAQGKLHFGRSDEVVRDADGRLHLRPKTPSGNILFHDRNDRDLERLMQAQAENAGVFRAAADLYRHQGEMIRSAIREMA
ncbi:MAG: hypothetical protein JJU33_07640 [Phycisphaerales bacterium]|nr:hypothetical protein [Phycisphaerales bacterium]